MTRLSEIRVLATALILSLALALDFGSAAVAALPGMSAGVHDIAGVHDTSSLHDACTQASCRDRIADCCSSVAPCSGSGCTAFVTPVDAPGFAYSARRAWATTGAQCLEGLDPFVDRHPPRDFA